MRSEIFYRWLADAVLALHAGVALFVVLGLALILVGHWRRFRWVDSLGFRLAHLAAIGMIALEAWFGVVCPLTTLEMWLRARAGEATYGGDFVAHWLQRLLYWDAPPWVFMLGYTLFGLLVLAVWLIFPPASPSRLNAAMGLGALERILGVHSIRNEGAIDVQHSVS